MTDTPAVNRKKRYKDFLKTPLKEFSFGPANWECLTSDRSTWSSSIRTGAVVFEDNCISKATDVCKTKETALPVWLF